MVSSAFANSAGALAVIIFSASGKPLIDFVSVTSREVINAALNLEAVAVVHRDTVARHIQSTAAQLSDKFGAVAASSLRVDVLARHGAAK
jgi:hypothetical protein